MNKTRGPGKKLGGEAREGNYVTFRVVDGKNRDPCEAVFPIFKQNRINNQIILLGTGFFIGTPGLFVTAAHVIRDVFDANGNQVDAAGVLQFLPNNSVVNRGILGCSVNNDADVAVCTLKPKKNKKTGEILGNGVSMLTTTAPQVGELVFTYAYPNTVVNSDGIFTDPSFYDGKMEEFYPKGRDSVLLPHPCYRTSMAIHGGASGGPVFSMTGKAFGVNCTGFDGHYDVSFVSRIDEILGLTVRDIRLPGNHNAKKFTVYELVEKGIVHFSQ